MLSDMMRTVVWCALSALIVGWWVPQLLSPPRWLPLPTHKRLHHTVPPHLDPGMQPQVVLQTQPVTKEKVAHGDAQWAVQLGSYRSLDIIQPTIKNLKQKGFPVIVKQIQTPQGPLYRIWVGQYSQAQAASQLAEKLRKQFHIQGFVLRLEH